MKTYFSRKLEAGINFLKAQAKSMVSTLKNNAIVDFLCRTGSAIWCDELGQDLVEYALVAALIGLGSVTGMKTLANYISNAFTTVGSTLVSSV